MLYLDKSQLETDNQKVEIYRDRARNYIEISIDLMKEAGVGDFRYETALLNYTDILDDLGQKDDAKKVCKEVLVYNDRNSNAYNLLASIDAVSNPDKALEYVEKAISYDPYNGFSVLTKAEIMLRNSPSENKKSMLL